MHLTSLSLLNRRTVLALVGALAFALTACSPSISIESARAKPAGTEVTVEGYVTVPPGAFSSAMGDEGFALQDDTAGLYVKLDTKESFGLGAHVRVTGTMDAQNKLLILKTTTSEIDSLSGTQTVTPVKVDTGKVDASVEGSLVRVEAQVSQTFTDDSPYGYKLYVNDGSGEVQVFVHISAGIAKEPLQQLVVGDTLHVTGLAARYEDTFEIAPRDASDLQSFVR
jgi:DNA/RNA endonuclease YhcR with UshA esterase domain